MLPSIIVPYAHPRDVRPQETRDEFLRRWHEDYAAGRETIAPPENVQFRHDPNWRMNAVSIQSAHDRAHPVWQFAWWLAYAAEFAWIAVGAAVAAYQFVR